MPDWLEQTLRDIDGKLPPPRVAADLAQRVLKHAAVVQARRSRLRAACLALTLIVLAVSAWLFVTTGNRRAERASLIALSRHTEQQALVVDWLLAAEQQRDAARRLADATGRLRSLASMELVREQAALTMVYLADRALAYPALAVAARQKYQRVIDLFPETSWADRARRQLAQLTQ